MAENTPSVPPRIFEHLNRKDWGRSVLLLEIPDKRTFLFEDGAERSFRPDYWHKMESLGVEVSEAVRIDRAARRNQEPDPTSGRKSKLPPKKPDITFEQQVAYFMSLYPVGFEDEKYIRTERGEAGAKGAEKLKDAAIERAELELNEGAVTALRDDSDLEGLMELAYGFFTGTKNTTTKTEAGNFKSIDAERHGDVAKALHEVLFGERPYAARFDTYITALEVDGGPSWPITTLLQALVYPNDHVFVKPTFMKKQALILDIDPKYDTSPNATTYAQFLEAAKATFSTLQEAGQRPRDLWDVQVFISKTLSPKAIKEATAE